MSAKELEEKERQLLEEFNNANECDSEDRLLIYDEWREAYSKLEEAQKAEQMNHPPIPPNCERYFDERTRPDLAKYTTFAVVHNDGWVRYYSIEDLLEERADYWRPIIAAVARCAWLDIGDKTSPQGEAMKCYKNADAWREWGMEK